MVKATSAWEAELRGWLEPFLECLGRKARRLMCPLYVFRLIGPGDRKSVQPMAERFAPNDYDQLHHFISAGVWDAAPVKEKTTYSGGQACRRQRRGIGYRRQCGAKKGEHSVGVAPHSLDKTANCQTLVSLTLARGEVPVVAALRRFLPENWRGDPARLKRTGVPIAYHERRERSERSLWWRSIA